MNKPSDTAGETVTVKLLFAAGVTVDEKINVFPSPKPDGSQTGFENNSSRNAEAVGALPLTTVPAGELVATVSTGKPGVIVSSSFTSIPKPALLKIELPRME